MSIASNHIKDIDGYIYFSSKTTGQVGKPVKIHSNLLIDFMLSVDPKTADGQAVIRDIDSLRAFANTATGGVPMPRGRASDGKGHKAQMQSIYKTLDATAKQMSLKQERSFLTTNVRVYYYIDQKPGDAYPTVYINEVQVRAKDVSNLGGFYVTVESGGRRKAVIKKDKVDLQGKSVFLSGIAESPKDVMADAIALTQSKQPTIFFTPSSATESLTSYRANRLNQSTQKLVNELADAIQKHSKHSISWTVEGEGASILSHALKLISTPIDKQQFNFINAKGNLPELISQLKDKKAELNGNFLRIDHSRRASSLGAVIAMAKHKSSLARLIPTLETSKSSNPQLRQLDAISRFAMAVEINDVTSNKTLNSLVKLPGALRGQKLTFIDVLTRMRGA